MRSEVAEAIRNFFNAPNRVEAYRQLKIMVDHYRKRAPRLAEWAEKNLPEGLTLFVMPASHR